MSDLPPALPPLPATLAANPVLSAWLDFTCPGVVTIGTGKVEYGQGVWTALAQVAAEELDVDLRRVRVAPVSTATSPDEGVTSGSRSIEESGSALRQACAQARHLFLAAAADRLGAGPGALGVTDGEITTDAGGTGLTYWSLAGQAGPAAPGLLDREAGDPEPAKAPARWSVAGRSAARLDLPDKVTGRPRFLHDLVLPGMLHGRVIRPPAPAASLAGLGDPPLPGDVVTVRDGSFLGVVAPSDRAAVASARAVAGAARWEVTPSLPDERDLRGFLLSAPAQVVTVDELHDREAAATVTRTLEAEFTRPYLAHASMAPSCAMARWDGRRVTVWSHSQGVFALRGAIAAGLGLEAGQVTVNHVEGAGAYGHNGADDAALDAVLLARAVPGHPVRVLWSREDEMGWAPVGPAMLARLSAGLDAGGRIRTWRQDVWSNGFIGRPGSGGEPRLLALAHLAGGRPMSPAPDGPPTGAMGSTRNAVPGYDIPDRVIVRHRLLAMPIRTSSLRSLGAFLNVFAIESFMDELAAAAGADPVEFRLAHLADPRGRRVIEQAAQMSGWAAGRVAPAGGRHRAWPGLRPVQGHLRVLRGGGAGGGRHRRAGLPPVARGRCRPGDQPGRGHQSGGGRRGAERQLGAAGAGRLRPDPGHVRELGHLPNPPVQRGAAGGGRDRGRARPAGDRRGRGRAGPGRRRDRQRGGRCGGRAGPRPAADP